jgi:hypothetical protein
MRKTHKSRKGGTMDFNQMVIPIYSPITSKGGTARKRKRTRERKRKRKTKRNTKKRQDTKNKTKLFPSVILDEL